MNSKQQNDMGNNNQLAKATQQLEIAIIALNAARAEIEEIKYDLPITNLTKDIGEIWESVIKLRTEANKISFEIA